MYLTRQGQVYYAVLNVPVDVRDIIGKTSFRKTLKTVDKRTAQARALQYVEKWKRQVEQARLNPSVNSVDILNQIQREVLRLNRTPSMNLTDNTFKQIEEQKEQLEDLAISELYKLYGVKDHSELSPIDSDKVDESFKIATGRKIKFTQFLESYLEEAKVEQKTKDSKRLQVVRFSKVTPTLDRLSREVVRQYIRKLSIDHGLKNKTIKRDLSNLAVYWDYLRDEQHLFPDNTVNPFKAQKLPAENRKEAAVDTRVCFSIDDIQRLDVALLARSSTGDETDRTLYDVFKLAIYTGARREEIGQLRCYDIGQTNDGLTIIKIEAAKTKSGNRTLPAHSALAEVVNRRVSLAQDQSDYLFPDLGLAKYGKRTDAIGKRFGRIKTALGFDKRYVFHSIRKTVTTLMEQAGVPEGVTADIVGHDKQTMTYGVYSGGVSLAQMRDAIEQLDYGL